MSIRSIPCSRCDGLTIIEFAIAVAIMGILLSMAVPSFRDLVENRRYAALSSDIASTLNGARMEAIKRGAAISLGPVSTAANDEWGNGFRVWLDLDGDNTYDSGTEDLIFVFPAAEGNLTVDLNDADGVIEFDSQGHLSAGAVNIDVCDGVVSGEYGRRIEAKLSGQVKITREEEDGAPDICS